MTNTTTHQFGPVLKSKLGVTLYEIVKVSYDEDGHKEISFAGYEICFPDGTVVFAGYDLDLATEMFDEITSNFDRKMKSLIEDAVEYVNNSLPKDYIKLGLG